MRLKTSEQNIFLKKMSRDKSSNTKHNHVTRSTTQEDAGVEDHQDRDINSYCMGEGNKKPFLYFNQENCTDRQSKMIDKWRKYTWSLKVNIDLIAHKINHKMSPNLIFIFYNSEGKKYNKKCTLVENHAAKMLHHKYWNTYSVQQNYWNRICQLDENPIPRGIDAIQGFHMHSKIH